MKTGIGSWNEDVFVARFKPYDSGYVQSPVTAGKFNTIMPWTCFATMREHDLRAIYAYLHTIQPVENAVIKFTSR